MKQRLLLCLCLVLGSLFTYAQPGGFQRRTVEEIADRACSGIPAIVQCLGE